MRITAFQIKKPKRFDYTPRYYDPVKELREERKRRVMRELSHESGEGDEGYVGMKKGDLRHYMISRRPADRRVGRGNFLIRLITIILALVVALLVFYGAFILVKLV